MEALLVVWFLCACVSAAIVSAKTESQGKVAAYFVVGLLLGIFGILLAAVAPNEKLALAPPPEQNQPTRTCPFCKERILADAIKCKHCGERLDEAYARLRG